MLHIMNDSVVRQLANPLIAVSVDKVVGLPTARLVKVTT